MVKKKKATSKARQLTRIVSHSVITKRTGQPLKPVLAGQNETALTFIGHSGFFVQMSQRNIVVDPNFARWLFLLKRLRSPGMRMQDLPPIDFLLVTHAHFDHLHRPSLRKIADLTRKLRGHAPVVIVPNEVGDLVADLGFSRVIELDWWESFDEDGLSIIHVPSRHWGARVLKDSQRGFGGFVIRDGSNCVYHAGDTAYFDGFKEIGRRLKPDIALLPIGAYDPPTFRNVHTSPEDALRGFHDLGSRWMIPMHYGTFRLSQEPSAEPVERLLKGARKGGIADRVLVLDEGVTRVFPPQAKEPA